MSKLYAWDELGTFELPEERDPDELRQQNEEGGWEYKETLPNGVAVLSTDRHFALEVMAESAEEAHEKFMAFPYYKEFTSHE